MASVPAHDFIERLATLKWFIDFTINDAERNEGVAALNKMLADGTLKITVTQRYPLDEIVAAHEMVEVARHMGNVVVDVA